MTQVRTIARERRKGREARCQETQGNRTGHSARPGVRGVEIGRGERGQGVQVEIGRGEGK